MTTRRDLLIAAAALPLLRLPVAEADASLPPGWTVEHVGPGHYVITHGLGCRGDAYASALARSMEATRWEVAARVYAGRYAF